MVETSGGALQEHAVIIFIILKAALLFRQKRLFIQGEVPSDQPEGIKPSKVGMQED